jgi:hypothetical protein
LEELALPTPSVLSPVEAEFELVFEVLLVLTVVPVTLFTAKVVSKIVPYK